jgi:hypothetical protein
MNVVCKHCQALHWDAEKTSKSTKTDIKFGQLCCFNGDTSLPTEQDPPLLLHHLLTSNNSDAKIFRENIRTINQAFSFVSVGVQIDERITYASGPFCFRIHGELSHRIGSLCPDSNQQNQQAFAQIYIHSRDSEEAILRRLQVSNLDGTYRNLFVKLQSMMHEVNPFIRIFKQAHQILAEKPPSERLDVVAALHLDPTTDRRRYNLPTVNEVAAIIPQNAPEGTAKTSLYSTDMADWNDLWTPARPTSALLIHFFSLMGNWDGIQNS